LDFTGEKVNSARITLGSVAPTIIHARKAESFLENKILNEVTIEECARLVGEDARPISDVRGSSIYRQYMVGVSARRGLARIASDDLAGKIPPSPVLLDTSDHENIMAVNYRIDNQTPIETTINGKTYIFKDGQNKTLLHLLREDGGLIGTKEGCSEGECGACTVFLDGMAVMSCMVPAPRAHGATITTIEGIASGEGLHPVQDAFMSEGAVQCGYCTPGFIMSSVKLLEEIPHPGQNEIRQALTGNLCRCTGYYSIIRAVEKAAMGGHHEQIPT
jgi:aerobic-type carbon monoxide dehydrogenase small subunit (CoxS/CutS family)